MSESVNSNVSSWLHAEVDAEGCITEAIVEGGEGSKMRRTSTDQDEMIQSFRSSEFASSERRTVCTSCSDSTRQLSEVVHRKMEDIVKELSLQISSLKAQLHDQAVSQQLEPPPQDKDTQEQKESEEPQTDRVEAEPTQDVSEQQEETQSQQNESQNQVEEVTAVEEERETPCGEENSVVGTAENGRPVLYSNTFLPTAPTAPVFLPEPRQSQAASTPPCSSPAPTNTTHDSAPVATQATPSASSQPTVTSHTPTPAPIKYRIAPTPAAALQSGTSFLPPPLMPETTPTALHAAVMSQFSIPHLTNTESDDDDYLSTSDNDDTAPLNPTQQQQQPQPQQQQPQQQQPQPQQPHPQQPQPQQEG